MPMEKYPFCLVLFLHDSLYVLNLCMRILNVMYTNPRKYLLKQQNNKDKRQQNPFYPFHSENA